MRHTVHLAHWSCTLLLVGACGGSSGDGGETGPVIIAHSLTIDAGTQTGALRPLWRDHYDLSYEHLAYAAEPGFSSVLASLSPRSWRCSVGRWEVGFPPPAGGESLDPVALAAVDREFYRGPNTLMGADAPGNYDFTYLDALLAGLVAAGMEPYLCFDYMPFTLAAEQDPLNANNANISLPGVPYSTYSFSNGIRTSPPADPAVYARVVLNTMRHVRGLFAGTTDYGVVWFEVGNEPDLVDGAGAQLPFFWTGTEPEFYDMYAAVAAEVDADPTLTAQVQIGAGSFALIPTLAGTMFMQLFLIRVASNAPRIDYVSFHSYGDTPESHVAKFMLVNTLEMTAGVSLPWVNAEWGRELGATEPIYDLIGHGILRAKVLALMESFPFVIAHEALFRDPGTSGGELGLIKTGPPAHKPVSHVYQGLGRLDVTPLAVSVTDNASALYVIPGTDAMGTMVHIAIVIDDPGVGQRRRISTRVENLPWGNGAFDVELLRVTQQSSSSGAGVQSVATAVGTGGVLDHVFNVDANQEGLYLLELTEQ